MNPPADRRSRPLRDLRISVTDRCNFRCSYCMPEEVFNRDHTFLPREEVLSFEEITRLARVFADQGVVKIRLTGGEPLLVRDLERLVEMLSAIDGIDDIALTTNGSALAGRAGSLKAAGLSRVTVSLDALDEAASDAMNGVGFPVARVLAGIEAAAAAGLTPVKVNMVVRRGTNDEQVLTMADHFRGGGHILRFIEFMDVGTTNRWRIGDVVPAAEIHGAINAQWPLQALAANYPGEVASRHRYLDGEGEIGLIASVTQPFCGGCARARVSADGRLYTCLFAADGHDLRALLRSGASDQDLTRRLGSIWADRSDRYSEARRVGTAKQPKVEMSYIGG